VQSRQESPGTVVSCYSEDRNCLYDNAHEARFLFAVDGFVVNPGSSHLADISLSHFDGKTFRSSVEPPCYRYGSSQIQYSPVIWLNLNSAATN